MLIGWEKYGKSITEDFLNELRYTKFKIESAKPKIQKIYQCGEAEKPIRVYTGKGLDLILEERPDHFYMYFGQGRDFPERKVGLAWLCDSKSILFFERPFKNKVLKVLKKLLPDCDVIYDKNDIIINGTKNGSSLRTGYQQQEGDAYYDEESDSVKLREFSEPLSGMMYILRWDDLDGLNEVFKESKHHQKRLKDKQPLATLSDFLAPKGITKQQFIDMLEDEEDDFTVKEGPKKRKYSKAKSVLN